MFWQICQFKCKILGTESLAGFFVCVILNGKLKQCMVSLKDLQSPKYTHCWVLFRLFEKCLLPKTRRVISTASPTNVFNIVANKDPTWLHYSEASYCLHLMHLSLPILTATVKNLQLGSSLICRSKEKCVSKIVDHFMLERNTYYSIYKNGKDIAALLRETPFLISAQANRNLIFSKDSVLAWFNETAEELFWRLHSSRFSIQCIVLKRMELLPNNTPAKNILHSDSSTKGKQRASDDYDTDCDSPSTSKRARKNSDVVESSTAGSSSGGDDVVMKEI